MKDYKIIKNYREDLSLRTKFYQFVDQVFPGFNFKSWYECGYWTDKYIPHSIAINGKIVSNVSISEMEICLEGKSFQGIQFGTVGTIPEFRGKGLSKYLMEYVLEKYEKTSDFFFLYANETVLEFYPKFDFERFNESIFVLESEIPDSEYEARKLDIKDKNDFNLIAKLLEKRKPLTNIFGAMDYQFITMWHILNVFSENIFYLEEDILFIVTKEKGQLNIWDIIFYEPFNINLLLTKIIPKDNSSVIIFHFPPDQLKFSFDNIKVDENSMFFVKGNFPLQTKHFKFPTTAQT